MGLCRTPDGPGWAEGRGQGVAVPTQCPLAAGPPAQPADAVRAGELPGQEGGAERRLPLAARPGLGQQRRRLLPRLLRRVSSGGSGTRGTGRLRPRRGAPSPETRCLLLQVGLLAVPGVPRLPVPAGERQRRRRVQARAGVGLPRADGPGAVHPQGPAVTARTAATRPRPCPHLSGAA